MRTSVRLALITCCWILLLTFDLVSYSQPTAYFVVNGGAGDNSYQTDSASGGKSVTQPIQFPGEGNWGTISNQASIGSASASITYSGNMNPVSASIFCNIYYGCGWSL